MMDAHPLPAPLTSRNLAPRSITSRSSSRSSSVHTSNSRPSSRPRSQQQATSQPVAFPPYTRREEESPDELLMQSVAENIGDSEADDGMDGRPAKRRKLDYSESRVDAEEDVVEVRKDKGKGKMRATEAEVDELDQLEYWPTNPSDVGFNAEAGPGPSSSQYASSRLSSWDYRQSLIDSTFPAKPGSSSSNPDPSQSPVPGSSLDKILRPSNADADYPVTSGARPSPSDIVTISDSPPPPVHISLISPDIPTIPLPQSPVQPLMVGSPRQGGPSLSLASPPNVDPNFATPTQPEPTLLSAYTCPICFSPPTNATLTPCGHVCCGSCLFAAVKAGIQRGANAMIDQSAMCPVCRAIIPGWDGKGGGVIGLKVRAAFSF